MSIAYSGNYSYTLNALDLSSKKRYVLAAQRGKAILDSELSELARSSLNNIRNYLRVNVGDGAFDDAFKIEESTLNNVNNFTIAGGAGSVDLPAMLVVKGIPALLVGDFDYNTQSNSNPIDSDNYTQTLLPGLTTPVLNRTDVVYLDLYFAEVSSELGSEYQDASLKDSVIGVQTANRFRIVQDIRVAEGSLMPSDGVDGNGIYHWYFKLATISRIGGDNTITSGMINDERFVVVTTKKLTDGTGELNIASLTSSSMLITGDLSVSGNINMDGDLIPNVAGTSNLGDSTHRFATLYMSSIIDTLGGLTIDHTELLGSNDALTITRSGTSTGNLLNVDGKVVIDKDGNSEIQNDFSVLGASSLSSLTVSGPMQGAAISASGLITFTNTTDSTGIGVGALVVSGGLGLVKNLSVGGNVVTTGSTTLNGVLISNNTSAFNNTTQSISTGSGAIVLLGGMGIAKTLNVGEDINVVGTITAVGGVTGPFAPTGVLHITDVTESTAYNNGALIVDGGVGIAKNLNVDGILDVSDITGLSTVGGNVTFTGNVTIQGTTTTISATNLVVTDKNITVNNGGNDASSEGAGLTVSRTSVAGSIIYKNSASSKFAMGDLGSEVNVVVESRQVNTSSPLTGGGSLSSDLTLGINSSSSNTPNYVVQRDGSGNFSAGTITASLSGNATTSTTATTASNLTRNVNVSGNGLSGGGSLNGADVTITSNATSSNVASTIVYRDGSGGFSAGDINISTLFASARVRSDSLRPYSGSLVGMDDTSATFYVGNTSRFSVFGGNGNTTIGGTLSVNSQSYLSGRVYVSDTFVFSPLSGDRILHVQGSGATEIFVGSAASSQTYLTFDNGTGTTYSFGQASSGTVYISANGAPGIGSSILSLNSVGCMVEKLLRFQTSNLVVSSSFGLTPTLSSYSITSVVGGPHTITLTGGNVGETVIISNETATNVDVVFGSGTVSIGQHICVMFVKNNIAWAREY